MYRVNLRTAFQIVSVKHTRIVYGYTLSFIRALIAIGKHKKGLNFKTL